MHIKRYIAAGAVAATGFGIIGSVAEAAPVTQQGLVNVNLSNIVVQVPVAVAANICDVNVGVLVGDLRDASAACNADSTPEASITPVAGSGPVAQSGLVNVNVTDLAVQVPIGIAANVCDVNVAVLVNEFIDSATPCLTDADGSALISAIP